MGLSKDVFEMYLRATQVLDAREALRDLYAIETPNLKDHARRKRYETLQSEAYPKKKNVITFDQFAKQVKN